jgi:phage terminase large subunit-like protein
MATSVGGVLTGRGADVILIDDPMKPADAMSESRRTGANAWFDGTLYSRLNDKTKGSIVIVMQRLHEDDLVGHVLKAEGWEIVAFPAIAEADETHEIETPFGRRAFARKAGEALHAERESLATLERIRATIGEANFAGQYQQRPAPAGGGMIRETWFPRFSEAERPAFERIIQSWDTANKPTELADYSVCTTWGLKGPNAYLVNVFRKRLAFPDLERAVIDQDALFSPEVVLIEDRASGTKLIQALIERASRGSRAMRRTATRSCACMPRRRRSKTASSGCRARRPGSANICANSRCSPPAGTTTRSTRPPRRSPGSKAARARTEWRSTGAGWPRRGPGKAGGGGEAQSSAREVVTGSRGRVREPVTAPSADGRRQGGMPRTFAVRGRRRGRFIPGTAR